MNPLIDALEAPLLDFAKSIIGRIWPDPAQQAEAQLKLATLVQNGELAQLNADVSLALAQVKVNEQEAASESIFKSGWRPAIGWVCGSAFAWEYVVRPMATFTLATLNHQINLPPLDMQQLMPVLMGLLGLGAMRTVEKIKGAQ